MHGIPSRRIVIAGVILIFPFFFLGGPAYQSARSLHELWNLGHVLFFAIFAILVYYHLLSDHVSSFTGICLSLISVIVLGLGIEVAQLGLGNRSVGWDDFFRDLAGAGIVFFWRVGSSGNNPFLRIVSKMTTCIIAAICLFPLSGTLVDEYRARQEFPLLSGFERRLELGRWKDAERLRQVDHPVRTGRYSAEIQLTTDKYSGVSLVYFPENWHEKKGLAFSVYNPGSPIELSFRVHDRFHTGEKQLYQDRFNGMRVLAGGWNDIVIPMDAIRDAPAGRKMDLAHIRGFGLFVMNQAEDRLLYLDDVRLLE
jgi:VanZ family protein